VAGDRPEGSDEGVVGVAEHRDDVGNQLDRRSEVDDQPDQPGVDASCPAGSTPSRRSPSISRCEPSETIQVRSPSARKNRPAAPRHAAPTLATRLSERSDVDGQVGTSGSAVRRIRTDNDEAYPRLWVGPWTRTDAAITRAVVPLGPVRRAHLRGHDHGGAPWMRPGSAIVDTYSAIGFCWCRKSYVLMRVCGCLKADLIELWDVGESGASGRPRRVAGGLGGVGGATGAVARAGGRAGAAGRGTAADVPAGGWFARVVGRSGRRHAEEG
jgi:hypothetical protein